MELRKWKIIKPWLIDLKMVSMMLLNGLCNLRDEGPVTRWQENPYGQNFIAVKMLQKRPLMRYIESDHRMNKHTSAFSVSWQQVRVRRLENVISDIVNKVLAGAQLSLELYRAALPD